MVDHPTQDPPPEFAVRPGDASWLASVPRVMESARHDWRAIHCLVAQRRDDGIAPIVLETTGGDCLRSPPKYEGAFELCLRHLHGRRTPLDVACTVGALLSNRAAHALKLPGRWVPTPDGVVEDYAAQSARPEEGALVATSGEKEPSSLDADASSPPGADACSIIPGTAFVRSSELSALVAPEPSAHEGDKEKDSLCTCDVSGEVVEELPNEEEVSCTDYPCLHWRDCRQEAAGEDSPSSICAEDGEEDGATIICEEDGRGNGASSLCADDGAGEDRPPICCTELGDKHGTTSTFVVKNGVNTVCSEGGVTNQVVELSHAEEDSCTEGTSPALEGGTPRSGASAEDQRPATYRRRRGGRQWQRAQVAHTAWWNEDAWRHSSEPRYPRGSQWRRTAAQAWRPKD